MKTDKPNATRFLKMGTGLALLVVLGAALMTLFDDAASPDARDEAAAADTRSERERIASASMPQGDTANTEAQEAAPESSDAQQGAQRTPQPDAARQGTQEPGENGPVERTIPLNFSQKLSDIIALLNADRFDEATLRLDELMTAENMAEMGPFGRSRLYQLSFNLNMQAENYDAASADIQAALESGGLTAQEYDSMSYQSGQLFVQMEDYAKAADSLELWVARPDAQPNKAAYYLLAASYYYQDRFDDARDHMETLMSMPGENHEAWYSMMASLYLQNEDYAKTKPVLETMVELYGKPNHREQLGAINARLAGAQ